MLTDRVVRTLQAARIGVWEWDLVSGVHTWSREVWSLLGLDSAAIEPSLNAWISSICPNDRDRTGSTLRKAVDNGVAIDCVWQICVSGGLIRYLMILGSPEIDKQGQPRKYNGILTEVTKNHFLNANMIRTVELEEEEGELKSAIDEIRSLNEHIIHIREEERRRIATDIHDDLGQRLTAINLGLHHLLSISQAESAVVHSEIMTLIQKNSEIIVSVQRIAGRLIPKLLEDLGLEAALSWLIADIGRLGGPIFSLHYEVGELVLSPNVSLAFFRCAQECISNILKHARAQEAVLTLGTKGDSLIFNIADNGVGINPDKSRSRHSMGLIGMRERTRQLGGTCSIHSRDGLGTTVEIVIPIAPAPGRRDD